MDYAVDAMIGYSTAFVCAVVLVASWLFGRS